MLFNNLQLGKESFKELMMSCARSALSQEDLARIGEGPIPDSFVLTENPELSKQLVGAQARLVQLRAMKGQNLVELMREEFSFESNTISLHNAKMQMGKKEAEEMIAQLHSWTPPTESHSFLKTSMEAELQCRISEFSLQLNVQQENLSGKEYLSRKIAAQEMYVKRLEAKVENEKARVKSINIWLNDLRQSLQVTQEMTKKTAAA